MPELSPAAAAVIKLLIVFGAVLFLLRLRLALWKAIFAGATLIALFCAAPLATCLALPFQTLISADFASMEIMIFGILALSEVQDTTGQSRRLVDALDRYIRWPKLRIILFPALVGLLPMPGGALFSCPMLEAASHGMRLSAERKSLINYWFRHIWETAWPLYPGYILAASLFGVSLLTPATYTFPFILFELFIGWFFFLRDIQSDDEPEQSKPAPSGGMGAVAYEALPLIVTLAGALVFVLLLGAVAPDVPSRYAFIFSLFLAVLTALYQGRGRTSRPLARLLFTPNLGRMLLLIYAVFVFKDMLGISGLIADMSRIGSNTMLLCLLFAVLPLCCGLLTGVLVGLVGASFPILIALAQESGVSHGEMLPFAVIALICGHVGQLASPLHVCLIVTCEFFHTPLAGVFKKLFIPLLILTAGGIAWGLVLFALDARF